MRPTLLGAAVVFVAVCGLVLNAGGAAGHALALGAVTLLLVGKTRDSRLGHRPEGILVVGGGSLAQDLMREIQARRRLRQTVLGYVDDGGGIPQGGARRLGSLEDLASIVAAVRPRRIVVALTSRRGRMPLKALLDLRLRGVAVEDGVEVYERLTDKIAIQAITPSSLIFCKDYRARLDLAVARWLSLPLVAAAAVLLAPVMALIAVAIKLDSPGPVFFVQRRVGRGDRPFRLIKFRTMRPAGAATSEWARDNDLRLTRLGRWLRRFRLDELPQLINVLTGEMNLIGPRPHPVTNLPLFVVMMRNAPECGEQIPFYALRSLVRPGITGWAQVRYRYANDLEEEVEKMRHDLYYIKHMSLWLDLRILCETVRIVLRGREAAGPGVAAVPATPTPQAPGQAMPEVRVVPADAPAAASTRGLAVQG